LSACGIGAPWAAGLSREGLTLVPPGDAAQARL